MSKNFELQSLLNRYNFTFQQSKIIQDMATDLESWEEVSFFSIVPNDVTLRDRAFELLKQHYTKHRNKTKSYSDFKSVSLAKMKTELVEATEDSKVFGKCPVASTKTLCCNLLTIDAVQNCSFQCSYCSIQKFYKGKTIVEYDLDKKIEELSKNIDPKKTYHFGTGQSSDSLVWGNRFRGIEALIRFARKHPNVIVELKSKSSNITHLLQVEIPQNVICSWSLNPQTIIENEEHGTASLDARLQSARMIADKGNVVGFHFHPIFYYDHFKRDYGSLVENMINLFSVNEVAMVSMGVPTYTPKVISSIREKKIHSKCLQMDLCDASGKLSYPRELKVEIFKTLYQVLSPWHSQVFIYLCMEPQEIWPEVMGFAYPDNESFEKAMHISYLAKIVTTRSSRRPEWPI